MGVGLLVMLALALAGPSQPAAAGVWPTAAAPVLPGICSDSDRFGIPTVQHQVEQYDVGQIHTGWWSNFWVEAAPPRPADMAYVQIVRLCEEAGDGSRPCGSCPGFATCPTWWQLEAAVEGNPGAVWLIGNEPDSMSGGQDNITPGRYAELYKVVYDWLKAHDPTCQVGIGGIVQPTPIRLDYLEAILDAYAAQNPGEPFMPIDVWNTHNYVLRERRYGLPDSWGAGVPPGDFPDEGVLYDLDEHVQMEACDPEEEPWDPYCADKIGWKQHLVNLRRFMADHGYRDRPLIISEYGLLMPAEFGFDWATTKAFMKATFDWMRTASDGETGYPRDGNRLVQAWAWWPFDFTTFGGMDGEAHVFWPQTRALTELGEAYAAYTQELTTPFAGSVDLRALSVVDGAPVPDGSGVVVPIVVTIENAGDGGTSSGPVTVQMFRAGTLYEVLEVPEGLMGGEWMEIVTDWPAQMGERIEVTAVVGGGQGAECDPYNNRRPAALWVAGKFVFLPFAGLRQ